MMKNAGRERRGAGRRGCQAAPPVLRDDAAQDAIGEIDEDFDAVDLGEIVRDVIGNRWSVDGNDAF